MTTSKKSGEPIDADLVCANCDKRYGNHFWGRDGITVVCDYGGAATTGPNAKLFKPTDPPVLRPWHARNAKES